ARDQDIDLDTESGRAAVAELVRDIELNQAKVICGYQDAYMVVNGGLQLMDFAGKHPVHSGPRAKLKSLDAALPFVLITTGVERLSGSVHGPMIDRWLSGDSSVASAMRTLASLATSGADALCSGDLATLGKTMTENHRIISSLGGS